MIIYWEIRSAIQTYYSEINNIVHIIYFSNHEWRYQSARYIVKTEHCEILTKEHRKYKEFISLLNLFPPVVIARLRM